MTRPNKTPAALLVSLAILVASATALAAPPPLWTPSVEKAYKDSLFNTNANDAARTGVSFTAFVQLWDAALVQFVETPPEAFASDRDFRTDLLEASGQVHYASALIGAGRLPEAHGVLEKVQYIMRDQRQRNGIAYFGDTLLAYHDAWEGVAHIATGAAAGLSDADVQAIVAAVPEMKETWRAVEAFPLNLTNADHKAQYQKVLGLNRSAQAKLDAALVAGDKKAILQAAAGLKPAYAALYAKWDWENSL